MIEYGDLATDLCEYGWGQSFHFTGCLKRESFAEHRRIKANLEFGGVPEYFVFACKP